MLCMLLYTALPLLFCLRAIEDLPYLFIYTQQFLNFFTPKKMGSKIILKILIYSIFLQFYKKHSPCLDRNTPLEAFVLEDYICHFLKDSLTSSGHLEKLSFFFIKSVISFFCLLSRLLNIFSIIFIPRKFSSAS